MREYDPFLGNYRMIVLLKSGIFANVYLAEHIHLRRLVAIKVLSPASVHSYKQRERFMCEASFLELLQHSHILPLLDYGIQAGYPYLVTEFAPNGSLRDLIEHSGSLPMAAALSYITQIGQALHFAHMHGVAHCDIKPENILLNADWQTLLADFHIATLLNDRGFSQVPAATGTPPYMPPEQFRGHLTPFGDQYSLACLAYELLTGSRPFSAANIEEYWRMHTYQRPIAPHELNPQIPLHISQAILKAMAKRRLARYPSVLAFIEALQNPPEQPASTRLVLRPAEKTKEQWLDEGIRLRKLGLYEQAMDVYKRVLDLDPFCQDAHHNIGTVHYLQGRYVEALAAYEQAIYLNPNIALPYYHKAITLTKLGRYQEALAAYEQLLRLEPNMAGGPHRQGGPPHQHGRRYYA